jgi:hypothetical protein
MDTQWCKHEDRKSIIRLKFGEVILEETTR